MVRNVHINYILINMENFIVIILLVKPPSPIKNYSKSLWGKDQSCEIKLNYLFSEHTFISDISSRVTHFFLFC